MPSGMEMLLNSFGINPQEMRESIEGFMATMKAAAEKINANQQRLEAGQLRLEQSLIIVQSNQAVIEAKLERIEKLIEQPGETTRLVDAEGKDAHVLVTTEKFPMDMLRDAGIIITEEASDGRS